MKIRLDQLLVDKGFFPSREKAKAAVMAGTVKVGGVLIDKAGTKIDEHVQLTVKEATMPYVSRGGLKLEKAIRQLGFSVEGKIVLDVGASTGGFTDC
ncbi:MAG: TlyA family rRNA (cytidine-2'-O)-methyltransferase, partial [Clostridia bacterium]|nr:TlyA family rRNA (cytidine-2'-O)-methyltransferase [Clostridia bacterium]